MTAVVAWILLASSVQPVGCREVHVDMLELNHVVRRDSVMHQILFWSFGDDGEFHVDDCSIVGGDYHLPHRSPLILYAPSTGFLKIHFVTSCETWSVHDPETADVLRYPSAKRNRFLGVLKCYLRRNATQGKSVLVGGA